MSIFVVRSDIIVGCITNASSLLANSPSWSSIVVGYIPETVACIRIIYLVYYWSDAIIVCHTQLGSIILGFVPIVVASDPILLVKSQWLWQVKSLWLASDSPF